MNITGIKSGMVMQRSDDNLCDIYFTAEQDITYVAVDNEYCTPKVEKQDNRYHLTGIRQGGPYTLMINEEVFTDIYVGDVWLLTGQSNMQGIGKMINCQQNNNNNIRAYYMNDSWDIANHPLHRMGESHYKVHTELLGSTSYAYSSKGVGPGLSFAQKMYDLTHVPQGVIACAHGGTNLYDQWNPDKFSLGTDKSLYAATYDRFIQNGANCKGIFWYQGCSDANDKGCDCYTENMIKLINAFRKDFKSNLPIVQVQIARCSWSEADNLKSMQHWTSIREQQRKLTKIIDNFDTVNTIAYRLSDCIHLRGESQETLGKDAAEAMFCLIYGKLYGCLPGIKVKSMEILPDKFDESMSYLIITYDNVHGKLLDYGRAMGFERSMNSTWGEHCGISDVFCEGNRVILRFDYKADELINQYLWYGLGRDTPANITDEYGRPIPAFGPIQIKNGEID